MRLLVHLTRVAMPMAIVAASSAEAVADDLPERWKRAELSVGAYLATFGSDLQVDSDDLGAGTNLDLEKTLDLNDEIAALRQLFGFILHLLGVDTRILIPLFGGWPRPGRRAGSIDCCA